MTEPAVDPNMDFFIEFDLTIYAQLPLLEKKGNVRADALKEFVLVRVIDVAIGHKPLRARIHKPSGIANKCVALLRGGIEVNGVFGMMVVQDPLDGWILPEYACIDCSNGG